MSRSMHTSAAALGWLVGIGALAGCSRAMPLLPPPSESSAGAHAERPASAGMPALNTPQAGVTAHAGAAAPQAGTHAAQAGTSGTDVPPISIPVERSTVAPDTAPAVADSEYATFVGHLNKFGLDLGQAMVSSNELAARNVVYSPLSASVALSMTYGGARTKTLVEMKAVLGDVFANDLFHVACNRLMRELASRATERQDTSGNTHKIELNLADALFVERSLKLQDDFLDLLGREYDSGVHQVDFKNAFEPARLSVNAWVSDQTKTKITDLIPQGAIDASTRVVLVNALYFYGSWASPFKANSTSDAPFNALSGSSVSVPTMHGALQLDYRSAADYAVADFPYEGNNLRMTVVLPSAGKFEAVRSQISAAWLEQVGAGVASTRLEVQLPKFKMTVGSVSLRKGLEMLGMASAFSGSADFSGITTDVAISLSEVLQKAFISVDENGTEAAAATAVIGGVTSVPPPATPFVVDRPFLYFIRDKSGAVLFSGHVVDPSQ